LGSSKSPTVLQLIRYSYGHLWLKILQNVFENSVVDKYNIFRRNQVVTSV